MGRLIQSENGHMLILLYIIFIVYFSNISIKAFIFFFFSVTI